MVYVKVNLKKKGSDLTTFVTKRTPKESTESAYKFIKV